MTEKKKKSTTMVVKLDTKAVLDTFHDPKKKTESYDQILRRVLKYASLYLVYKEHIEVFTQETPEFRKHLKEILEDEDGLKELEKALEKAHIKRKLKKELKDVSDIEKPDD